MESVPSKCASRKILRIKKKMLHFSFVSHDSVQVAYHEKKGKD
jgi:hypothetical protein